MNGAILQCFFTQTANISNSYNGFESIQGVRGKRTNSTCGIPRHFHRKRLKYFHAKSTVRVLLSRFHRRGLKHGETSPNTADSSWLSSLLFLFLAVSIIRSLRYSRYALFKKTLLRITLSTTARLAPNLVTTRDRHGPYAPLWHGTCTAVVLYQLWV